MVVYRLVRCLGSPRSILEIYFQDFAAISHLKPVISDLASHVDLLSSGITWRINLLVTWSSQCTCSSMGLS